MSARVSCSRNISGFRFTPTCKREERRELEDLLARVHQDLRNQDLKGKYFPLPNQPNSYSGKYRSMSQSDAQALANVGFLFHEPQTSVQLSAGVGRHWPEARGVYASDSDRFMSWFNQQDHLYMTAVQKDGNLVEAFFRLSHAHRSVEKALETEGRRFAHMDRMGYLTVCPSNLGTGLHASVTMRLPMLSQEAGFREICRILELQPHQCSSDQSMFEVQNMRVYGQSETEILNVVINGCYRLVNLEMTLASGGHATKNLTSNFSNMLNQWSEDASKALVEQRTEAFLRQMCPGLQDKDLQSWICTLPENEKGDVSMEELMAWFISTIPQLDQF